MAPTSGSPTPATSRLLDHKPSGNRKSGETANLRGEGPQTEPIKAPRFTAFTPTELLGLDISAEMTILSEGTNDIWYRGSPALVLGGCGIGKSRWVLSFAAADVLERRFCGFQTHGAGRWLIVGSENSVRRMQTDVGRIVAGWTLTDDNRKQLDENLKIVAFTPGDEFPPTNLDDPAAVAALNALAAEHRPDVVVIDPWEAFLRGGNSNEQGEVRLSFNVLQRIFRGATVLVVHHAREGSEAIKGATGFNSTAFGKGAKNLTSMARFIFNLTPLHATTEAADKGHGLVISCGKSNDSRGFATRAVTFDDNTGNYVVDGQFDATTYRADVDGKRSAKIVTVRNVWDVVNSGKTKTGEIIAAVRADLGACDRTIRSAIITACRAEFLTKVSFGVYAIGPKQLPAAS